MTDETQAIVSTSYVWDIAKFVLPFVFGAGGTELLRYFLQRSRHKTRSQALHTSTGLQAFQVADESLAEWMDTARNATRDLLQAVRKLNQSEMLLDEAIRLLETAIAVMAQMAAETASGTTPVQIEALQRDMQELIRERIKYQTSGVPDK